jgi:hypothetical protein
MIIVQSLQDRQSNRWTVSGRLGAERTVEKLGSMNRAEGEARDGRAAEASEETIAEVLTAGTAHVDTVPPHSSRVNSREAGTS